MHILITLEVEKSMPNSIMAPMAITKDLLNRIYSLSERGIKLGLDNMFSGMKAMELDLKNIKVVHIAGTNGKGSTAMTLYSLIRAQLPNKKVGLYTSPHLVNYNERIIVNDKCISDSEIENIAKDIFEKTKLVPLTFFEFTTLMAFVYFKQEKIDYAVIETGLGGRLDATNVLSPDVAIITSIGIDHTEYLGNDINKIALEKAGIFKKGSKAVISSTNCSDILKNEALKTGLNPIYVMGHNFDYEINKDGSFNLIQDGKVKYVNLNKVLNGDHQYKNAACAIMASTLLGIDGNNNSISKGLEQVSWKGRLEELSIGSKTVILDVSHNEEGIHSTADFIKAKFKDKNIYTACGFMKDKDYRSMIDIITKFSKQVFLMPTKVEGRALTAIDYQEVKDKHPDKVEICKDYQDCFNKIMQKDGIILFTGSIYSYEHLKNIIEENTKCCS